MEFYQSTTDSQRKEYENYQSIWFGAEHRKHQGGYQCNSQTLEGKVLHKFIILFTVDVIGFEPTTYQSINYYIQLFSQ